MGAVGLLVGGPDAAEQVHKIGTYMNASPASTMSQGASWGAAGVGAGGERWCSWCWWLTGLAVGEHAEPTTLAPACCSMSA